MNPTTLLALASSFALIAPLATAGETHRCVPLSSLRLEGELPNAPAELWRFQPHGEFFRPYLALDGAGEAFIGFPGADGAETPASRAPGDAWIAIDAPDQGPTRGVLILPEGTEPSFRRVRFELAQAREAGEEARFQRTKAEFYGSLVARGLPGAAWFRFRVDEAREALAKLGQTLPEGLGTRPRGFAALDDLDETFELFSGGRALSENLQLDRELAIEGSASATVPIGELAGITTTEFDWSALVRELKPELDALASLVPADQHAVFFPSFDALVAVVDGLDAAGAPIALLAELRSEDAYTRARYERQMCLPLDERVRKLGPLVVKSVALTGSDPYLRTGSDVAVLLESENPAALRLFLAAERQRAVQRESGARAVEGELDGVRYEGAATDDRRLSSYAAVVERCLVVANSLEQLRRVIATSKKTVPSLAAAPEYVFFRDRYRRGADGESAFAVLTDATIRRWCGPRWRIATSRRTRAAAGLAQLQSARVAALAMSPDDVPREPRDETWGTLEFQTPIAEVPIEQVTAAERDAYARFRDRYQSNWRQYFDPIALRIAIRPAGLGLDLSVMPLIAGSDYREMMRMVEGGKLAPLAGDIHAGALVHLAFGIDSSAPTFQRSVSLFGGEMFGADPLSWLGKSVAVYADDDPFWKEWAEAAAQDDQDVFLEDEFTRAPVAVRFEVKDPLRLAAFLTSLRAMSDQAAPSMVRWETRKHGELAYVALFGDEALTGGNQLAIYYAALPDALIVTLREDVLQRALDRRAAPANGDSLDPWLGESIALRVERPFLALVSALLHEEREQRAQRLAWSNLPALNEWRRMFPAEDALALHERTWKARLACPAGGSYAWNDEWKTYESTLYGHPAAPREGPDLALPIDGLARASFGLTFEHDGVRARVELER